MGENDYLEAIISEWEKDSKIDINNIQTETVNAPFLHSKYLRMLSLWKKRKYTYTQKMLEVRRKKTRYYRGEMSREELRENGWEQYQGNRLIRSELEDTLKSDGDVVAIQSKLDLIDSIIYVLESIIKMIGSRDFELSNYIKYAMFMKGEG
jgi:hypothetical protein